MKPIPKVPFRHNVLRDLAHLDFRSQPSNQDAERILFGGRIPPEHLAQSGAPDQFPRVRGKHFQQRKFRGSQVRFDASYPDPMQRDIDDEVASMMPLPVLQGRSNEHPGNTISLPPGGRLTGMMIQHFLLEDQANNLGSLSYPKLLEDLLQRRFDCPLGALQVPRHLSIGPTLTDMSHNRSLPFRKRR